MGAYKLVCKKKMFYMHLQKTFFITGCKYVYFCCRVEHFDVEVSGDVLGFGQAHWPGSSGNVAGTHSVWTRTQHLWTELQMGENMLFLPLPLKLLSPITNIKVWILTWTHEFTVSTLGYFIHSLECNKIWKKRNSLPFTHKCVVEIKTGGGFTVGAKILLNLDW